jgi:hypothetical protein
VTASSGQTLLRIRPPDLLEVETGTFAEWLHAARPTPVSAEEKSRILRALPRQLQALAAHEIGHEYFWAEYASAVRLEHRNRLREVELLCDAIGVVVLHRLGLDSPPLISAIEKLNRFNRDLFGLAINESNYPTLSDRRALHGELATGCKVRV